MNAHSIVTRVVGGLAVLGLAASSAVADQYLVKVNAKNMNRVASKIEAKGGTINHRFPQIGYLAVEAGAGFMTSGARIRGVQAVMPDLVLQWQEPLHMGEFVLSTDFANPPISGDDDFFFDLQWGHDAVNAVEAWNAGVRGAGVRVAVLDGGFDLTHPDLLPNIDFVSSMDFTGEGLQYTIADFRSHGSHTAGTIGAADNAYGTIGIAPEATLILIKGLGDGGSGSFANIIAGILHAAEVDADVLNMSLGATIPRNCDFTEMDPPGGNFPAASCAALLTATHAAITHAYQSGVAVFASIGNDGRDLDADKSWVEIPGQGPHHAGISATAPIGWLPFFPNAGFDNLAFYSNYGITGPDFSAPGGSVEYPGNEGCLLAGQLRPCWFFDTVFSTGSLGSWYWSIGTSMASPHAAGVAALIISENGGSMKPAHVFRELRDRAETFGIDDKTPEHGHGAIRTGY